MTRQEKGGDGRDPGGAADEGRRMEVMGRLAAGVAHDFNNVLAAIRGYSQIALRSLDGMIAPSGASDRAAPPDEAEPLARVRADVAAIDESARLAAVLTRQLATLSRPAGTDVAPLDLNALASELHGLARRLLPAHLELALAPADGAVTALANESALFHAAFELILDLRDSLADPGRITVATIGATAADPRVALILHHPAMPGGAATVRTRRLVGDLLRAAGGELRDLVVAGQPSLVISLREAEGTSAAAPRSAPPTSPGGSEGSTPPAADAAAGATVLLVEDDAAVRRIARTVLERLGYRVVPAGEGAEALRLVELLASDGVTPDLLVTDVTMPGMSGPALAAELRRRSPELGVLFMSGMGEPVLSRVANDRGREDFLEKPFTLEELAARVAGLLAAR